MTSLKQREAGKRRPAGTKKLTRDDKEQARMFVEKARDLGCDKNSAAADELLGRLAKMPPQPHSFSKTKRRT
jgi:hypothetical protein